MRVVVNNKPITLTKQDFKFRGGEADIFFKNCAYKIFHNLKDVPSIKKIKELSVLKREKNIVCPEDMVYNESNKKIIGFTTKVINGETLLKVASNTWVQRHNIKTSHTTELVLKMREITKFIHSHNILIIDGNELNYLISGKNFTEPYFLDTTSYKTPNFPPTMIMPSIRDYTTKDFTKLTDWFSFAIVTFILYVGIHPFKGTHPNYKKIDFENRIKDGVSLFNKNVKNPGKIRDIDNIPNALKNWYVDIFENKKRCPPPDDLGKKTIEKKITKIFKTSSDNFEIMKLIELDEDILYVSSFGYSFIIKTKNNIFIDKKVYPIKDPNIEFILDDKFNPVFLFFKDNKLYYNENEPNNFSKYILCYEYFVNDNYLFIIYENMLVKYKFVKLNKLNPFVESSSSIFQPSYKVFSNMIISWFFEKTYITLLESEPGFLLRNIEISQLTGYRIINAKYDKVIFVIGFKNGQLFRFIIKTDGDNNYKIIEKENVQTDYINFISTQKGIIVSIDENEIQNIFFDKIDDDRTLSIKDPVLKTDMVLKNSATYGVVFYKENKLFSIKRK